MELTSATLPGVALTLIHTGQAPTRSALTSRLGVTRATIGAITGELRDLGLIEVDPGPPGTRAPETAGSQARAPQARGSEAPGSQARGSEAPGSQARGSEAPGSQARGSGARAPEASAAAGRGPQGRPSHRLLPDPAGPVAVAAHVHPDGFAVALVGLGGAVVARRAEHGPVAADPGRALAPVAEAAAALLAESGRRCAGAAVAVPAAVTRPGGTAVRALYAGWPDGAPVRDIFAAELARRGVRGPGGCDAVNDVNALALAEYRHGAGRDATHLLVVSAEYRGVGGALVQGGTLYAGSGGLAMEAGHVSVDPDGLPCLCGNRGCLSVEADVERFLGDAGRPAPAGTPVLDDAVAVLRAGYPGDRRVRAAADAVTARLGLALAGLINVVNPDRVLLGGMYRELLAAAPERLREAVTRRSPWGHGAGIPIECCDLDDAALIGAAEIAWQPVLDNPALLRPR